MKKKNILLFGPIGDLGGRELEIGFIAKSLMDDYEVNICSSSYFTNQSQTFDFIPNHKMFSLASKVMNKYFIIKMLSFFAYLRFGCKYSMTYYYRNSIAKKYANVVEKTNHILEELVENSDLVIICAQLSSAHLKEIVTFSKLKNKPILFRTTGTILKYTDAQISYNFSWLENVKTFIHHSESNASKLSKLSKHNYVIIDQCAYNEDKLKVIPLKKREITNFIVLSRLSKEKQIEIVINAFITSSDPKDYLHIYGSGPELATLKQLAFGCKNIIFHGYISHNFIYEVFKKNDCLIISSIEEAGPLSGIEAMAAGIPIISTRVGAMPERLLNYDFWYNGTQHDLEKQIKIIKNNNVLDISKALRKRYISTYSQATIKRQYLSLIKFD